MKQIKKIQLTMPDEYCLLALYATNNDYHMAWLLNIALQLQMQREEGNDLSLFSDRNSLLPIHFVLIANKHAIKQNFPQYTQVDYFLRITNATTLQINDIVKKITEIDSVIACSPLQLKKSDKLFKMLIKL